MNGRANETIPISYHFCTGSASFSLPLRQQSLFIHAGQFLAGIDGVAALVSPPILSSLWFPARQRTVATAIGTMCNVVGCSLSFLVGPAFVDEVVAPNATSTPSMANASFTPSLNASYATTITPFTTTSDHSTMGWSRMKSIDLSQ